MSIFSNRELSVLIWGVVILTALLFVKNIRQSSKQLFKALFVKQIMTILFLLILFTVTIIFFFYKINLWDKSLLKDTIFWFFGVALVLSYKANNAKDFTYFKEIIKDTIKWTIIIEFLINFYTFSLLTELILIPVMVIVVLLQTVSEMDKKNEQVTKLLKNVTAIFGLILLSYVVYKTFTNYKMLFALNNLFSFLLPIILTIIVLPFIYFLSLYINYETLFVRIKYMTKDNSVRLLLRKEILLAANFNIEKLHLISKKMNNYNLTKTDDVKKYIYSLVK
jgi:hypothetical protein